jgi:AcrR family transcriptional regulator
MATSSSKAPNAERAGMRSSGRKPGYDDPATGARRELLAADVLDKAAVLFATQGFAATSLKDVADAVGLQRSSIYYYYPNKDALLSELIQGVTLPVTRIFREVEAEELPPLAKIREVVRRIVLWVADPVTHFRLLDRSEGELPEAIAKAHQKAKRQILGEMHKLVEEAILAGEARAVDPRVCAFSIIGMAMWTAWWFQPGQTFSLKEVADQLADNALAMLRRTRPAKEVATIAQLTHEIRENLSLIDRMTGKDAPE